MANFLSILKTIGGAAVAIAPMTATAFGGPTVGAIVSTVLSAVLAAERPGVSGTDKKVAAMVHLAVASPALVLLIESSTGRVLKDEAKLRSSLDRLVDAMVDLLNAFEILPAKAP